MDLTYIFTPFIQITISIILLLFLLGLANLIFWQIDVMLFVLCYVRAYVQFAFFVLKTTDNSTGYLTRKMHSNSS